MIYFRFGEIGNFQEFRNQWTDGGTFLATDGSPMNTDRRQCPPVFIGAHRCPIRG
jgi:hypothetical protein